MEWARNCHDKESDLRYLLHVLKEEINRREKADTFQSVDSITHVEAVQQEKKRTGPKASAAALQTSSSPVKGCEFCSGEHRTQKCWEFLKLSVDDRTKRVQDGGLCFKCLSPTHIARKCRAQCVKCKGRHHHLLCKQQTPGAGSVVGQSDFPKTKDESNDLQGKQCPVVNVPLKPDNLPNSSYYVAQCNVATQKVA